MRFASPARRSAFFGLIVLMTAAVMAAILYGPPAFVPTGLGPASLAVADFNGDGHLDLASANWLSAPGQELTVRFGDGAGGFPTGSSFAGPAVPHNIAAADMDNDTDVDLVVTTIRTFTPGSLDGAVVLLNNGTGTFTALAPVLQSCLPPPNQTTCDGPTAVAVADLNEDGDQDIIVTSANNGTALSLYLADGSGGFLPAAHPAMPAGTGSGFDVVAAYFNGDGHVDLGLAINTPGQVPSGVAWMLGNGDGTFGAATVFNFPFTIQGEHGAVAIAAADIDHDGDTDTATVAGNGLHGASVFLNDGTGTAAGMTWSRFSMPQTPANPIDVVLADLDGDSHVDILTVDQFGIPPWGDNLAARPGVGDGTFGAVVAISVGYVNGLESHWNPRGIAAADLDCDGKADLIAGHEAKEYASVMLANGGGGGVDTTPPVITAPADISVTAGPSCTATIDPGLATATDGCGSATVNGVRSDGQPLAAPYPVGTTTILWTATDASSNSATATQSINVAAPPPVIGGAGASPSSLWPPNHKMIDVTIDHSVTGACGAVTCVISSVASSEPENGLGDGDTGPDWEIVDNHHVRLRAERAGGGPGRVYTIEITCSDTHGHTTTATVAVTVPGNNGK